MAKRKHPGFNSEFKAKIGRLLAENSSGLEFRPFKKFFSDEGFKTIWLRDEESLRVEEQEGFIFCENQACKSKRVSERVSLKDFFGWNLS